MIPGKQILLCTSLIKKKYFANKKLTPESYIFCDIKLVVNNNFMKYVRKTIIFK